MNIDRDRKQLSCSFRNETFLYANINSTKKYIKKKKTKIVERDKTKKLEIGEMKRNRDAISS